MFGKKKKLEQYEMRFQRGSEGVQRSNVFLSNEGVNEARRDKNVIGMNSTGKKKTTRFGFLYR